MDWFPWYPVLYREHTLHLTAEQDGIYRRLIDHYMETRSPLPNNEAALARIAGVDISCYKHASSIILAFFKHENGVLRHKKCDEILDEQDALAKFRTNRAKKAANARHYKTKELCLEHASSNAQAMLKHATITVDNNNNSNKVSKNRGSRFTLTQLPAEWYLMAETINPSLEINKVFETFRDYWIAQPGSRGVKLDWDATWRNWVRRQKNETTSGNNASTESRWVTEAKRIAKKWESQPTG